MGTDNPKVSAYVPQALKNRLKEFRKERNDISESQAVTIILAEYFQMPEVLGRSPENAVAGGVTLGRMEALEEKLTDLATLVDCRLQKLGEEIEKISRLSVVHQVTSVQIVSDGEQDGGLPNEPLKEVPEQTVAINAGERNSSLDEPSSEPPQEQENDTQESSLLSKPPEELAIQPDRGEVGESSSVEESVNLSGGQEISEVIEVSSTESKLLVDHQEIISDESSVGGEDSSPDSEPPKNREEALLHHSELPFELKSEPPIEFLPLSSVKLSKRFGKGEQTVKRMRLKYRDDVEKFIEWNRGQDPDKIAWEHVSKGYVPLGELTQDQRAKLQKWYKENS
jgi:hypothetical protein